MNDGTNGGRGRLPFSHNLVFTKVMCDRQDLCKRVVELALGREIGEIEEFGIESATASIHLRDSRFDVLIRTSDELVDLEMQASREAMVARRARLSHSHMARQSLAKDVRVADLPDSYSIFICLHDPFGRGLPAYTLRTRCDEDLGLPIGDGMTTVVLNAESDASHPNPGVAAMLQYAKSGVATDGLTRELERAVDDAYLDEEWAMGIWTLEDMLVEAKGEGFDAGRKEGLEEGLKEGRKESEIRLDALLSKMSETGLPPTEILSKIAGDKEALYHEYGIA